MTFCASFYYCIRNLSSSLFPMPSRVSEYHKVYKKAARICLHFLHSLSVNQGFQVIMVAKNNLLSTLVFAAASTCIGTISYFLSFFLSAVRTFFFFFPPSGITMVNAQACARNYTVQPGDDCNKISAAQNVSTYVIITTSIHPIFLFFF